MKRTTAVGGMILALGLALMTQPTMANNITVKNVVLVNQDTIANTMDVQFDLSWQNSWFTVPNADYPAYTNWDAAWVFVKFEQAGLPTNAWQHAILSTNAADHTPAANSVIKPSSDGLGALVYRSAGYTGDVSYASMRLHWNYGANGYAFARGASVIVSVQAIEMVYVPQGRFYLGSTGGETASFYDPTVPGQNTNAFYVTNELAITVGTSSGNLYYSSTGADYGDGLGIISNVFPKGYNAFYCMKYDISQGQYCGFLNMLTRTQQNIRTTSQAVNNYAMGGTASIQNRESIRCPAVIPGVGTNIVFGCDANGNGVFDEPNDGMDRACNWLSWSDGAAYAAWAGLRPMTELEFEKACRGPVPPFACEYAWGASNAPVNLSTENSDGYGTSTANPANANCLFTVGGEGGPCRAGIFATTSSTRTQAGASYWGIMELSGNLWKRTVTVGSPRGRGFMASNGSGILSASGQATNADWYVFGSASDGGGAGARGGSWNDVATYARVSARYNAAHVSAVRSKFNGWRAVRSEP